MISGLAWVGIGVLGALGALARFRVGNAVSARLPGDFPAGTFVVNLTGSFALGLLTGLSLSSDAMLVWGTGLLGAYTTFSTWMVEAQRLAQNRQLALSCLYLVGSMLGGLGAAGAGWLLGSLAA